MTVRPRRSRKLERWRSMKAYESSGLLVVAALLACCSGFFLQLAAAETNSKDVAALQVLSREWNGVSEDAPWTGNDPCGSNWIGIVCNIDGAVTQLNLVNMNLSGSIPPAIGDLSNLEVLELSLNPNLGGTLPKELGKLVKLKSLSIQQCAIEGQLPIELSSLVELEFLAVNHNNMIGGIPYQIGRLSKLYWFDISLNTFGGSLPVSSGNKDGVGLDTLPKIKHFHFNNNTLQGNIPPEIFTLPSLIHLLLDSNKFIGEIPNGTVIAPIQIMRLDNNQLIGPIPDSWGQLKNLTEIHVSNNQLVGTIPDLSALPNLRLLDTSNNLFDPQPIPSFLGSGAMPSLQTLSMESCNLQGGIPTALFRHPVLQKIDMSNNQLNGTLTFGEIGQHLELIDLEGNRIESFGGTPVQNGVQVTIANLLLKGNPVCNSSFVRADEFCVDDPGTSTSYPQTVFCAGKVCTGGKVLHGGTCTCGDAMVCEMVLNSPPYQIVDSTTMSNLSRDLAGLFSMNKIISERLDRVKGQVTLDFDQVWIERANLSLNSRINFSAAIFPPPGRDWKWEEYTYIVNFLYNNSVHLPPQQGPYNSFGCSNPIMGLTSSSSLGTGALIGIIVGAVVLVIIMGLIAFYALRQKKRADRAEVMTRPFASWGTAGGTDNGAPPQLKGARFFTVNELKKATNNFSERNEIGSGGYGKVYRGLLVSGDVVAVKRAQEGSMQGKDEFKTEIELLSRVHHRNLVGLVGFCYERDQGEQMLVYEFMVNGTLKEHLLGRMGEPLTWQNRLNIALGCAKGLSYLHELANPPIIHRDIKSTNILLDERLVAKVADFGLSKLAPLDDGGKDHVSTQVKGTLGYLDPEYYTTHQLTEKSDVYSFGVVLLELLTARAPIEKGKYIVREVRTALDRGGIAALRPLLDRHIKDCPTNELEDFLGLALQCVEEAAKNRPTMNELVRELERICGHSFTTSVVGIAGVDGRATKDPYSDENLSQATQFQYSGGLTVPPEVQPK